MIRTIFFVVFGIILLLLSFPISLVLLLCRKKGKYAPASKTSQVCVMFIAKALCFLAGCKWEIRGTENIPESTAIFAGNHQGNFDTLLAQFAFGSPKITMTKKEASYVPIANIWMYLIKAIFVDRKNLKKSVAAYKQSVEYINHGFSVLYFPEGTRSQGPNMGQFKNGAFSAAVKTQTQIVPFAIDGTYKVYEQQHYLKKEKVIFSILPPIEVSRDDDPKALSERVKAAIQNELDNIRNSESI